MDYDEWLTYDTMWNNNKYRKTAEVTENLSYWTGVALEPGTALSSIEESEFYIVRDNSKRISGPRDPAQVSTASSYCFFDKG